VSSYLTPFQLENLRIELIDKILSVSSYQNVVLYTDYFSAVLDSNNEQYFEAFLKEFIEDFLTTINKYDVWGADPLFTNRLIGILDKLSVPHCFKAEKPTLLKDTARIKNLYDKLLDVLEGKENKNALEQKANFPLIDKETTENVYGLIDSITIGISKCNEYNRFIIVPSEKDIEKKIEVQVKTSWQLALALSKKYLKKTFRFHEVIISFDKRVGFYEGNSLGIALTLSFLEQLLKFYNPVYVINIKEQSAFTGGVNDEGKILTTGEEIIKQKVKAVFFSEIKNFVIPKFEESYAYFALAKLQKDYPKRKLKIIPVEDLNDVVNRRDLIDIQKQKLVVRSGKFVKKNWISAVVTVLLAMLFSYLFVMDFDDNPVSFYADGQSIYFKNKSGKILWKKDFNLSKRYIDSPNYLKGLVKIVNIDSDEQNEVLFAQLDDSLSKEKNFCDIKCYSSKGELIWKYSFGDTVSSLREKLLPYYGLIILDTITISKKKNLFIRANSSSSFSSAIFRIDLRTGERVPGTLWCSGHTYAGIIKDIDNDGKKDILCVGLDNGYEDAVFFGYEIDTLTKVRLTTDEYLIRGYKIKDLITYIRLPKTDYDEYKKFRTPGIAGESFVDFKESSSYQFYTMDYLNNNSSCLWYQIGYNLKDVNIIIDSRFRVMRDSLVSHRALPLPYTDTPEFVDIQKNRILYLKNKKWVKREELE